MGENRREGWREKEGSASKDCLGDRGEYFFLVLFEDVYMFYELDDTQIKRISLLFLLAHYVLSLIVITITFPLNLKSRSLTETDRDFILKPPSAKSRSLRQTFLEEAHRH